MRKIIHQPPELVEDLSTTTLSLQLMPNPTSEQLIILADGLQKLNLLNNIRIFDITGKEMHGLYSYSRHDFGAKIDVVRLPVGMYILTLESEGKLIQEKFIKQ